MKSFFPPFEFSHANSQVRPPVLKKTAALVWATLVLVFTTNHVMAQTYTAGTAPATNGATISTCSGTYTDSGGTGGNYGTNQDITVTFCSNTGQPLTMSFDNFNVGIGDFMYVYDGPNTSSPQFSGSPYSSGGFAFGPKVKTSTGTCITIRFTSNGTNSANDQGWLANIFCATTASINNCTGNFYDPGGVSGNTPHLNSTITTICSDLGGQIRTTFSSFALDAGFDFLYVYNGPDRTSPQVAGSPFSATSPGIITGSGNCLTFHFISDAAFDAAGWAAAISCVNACAVSGVTAMPTCAGGTYTLNGAVTFTNPPTSGILTVAITGGGSQVFNAPFTSPVNYSITGQTPDGALRTVTATFSAFPDCTNSTTYTAPASCGSGAVVLNGATNGTTVTGCSGKFADSGDIAGAYGNNENNTITFCSGNTSQISLSFNNFATQAGSDLLYVYDGPNTSAPQVPGSPFSGVGQANSPGVVSSTGTCLTFRFESNGSTTNFGWDADISCSGGVAAAPTAPTWNGYPGTACSPTTKIEGTVYEDFNSNGQKGTLEPGIRNVTVTLYNDAGQVGVPTTTNAMGFFTFTGLTAGALYRVEFTVPNGLEEGTAGTGSGTAVQFVKAGTCSANLGLLDKARYCGVTNPTWIIPVFYNGSPTHSSNTNMAGVMRFLYSESGQSPAPSLTNYVTTGTIGTTWGTAYDRQNADLYMSAVLKRHSGLGPSGIGAIYKRNAAGANTSSILFYNFGGLAGTDVADNATRFPGTGNAFGQVGPCGLCDNIDPTTFGQVGKRGLGDIEMSGDEQTLYVTNLNDRKIYAVSTNNPAPGSATPLPNQPWLTGSPCNNGTARPWALKVRRDKLYVGVVCDGGSSTCSKTAACSDLTATVYSFNGTTWTQELTFPLNYYRKAYATGSNYWVRWMDNWSDFTANYANVTDVQFAQPIFANIEFDDDGSLIMGFADRTALQTGYQAPPPPGPASSTAERTFAHGDILRAYFNPNTQTFSFENNGVVGPLTTTNPSSTSGPGGKSFYWGDFWYGGQNNTGIGALAVLPGSGEVMTPIADPIDPYASGMIWLSNTNGKSNKKMEIYQGSASGNSPNFAKNGGLGDIELQCAAPPLEIGNYVWWDHNLNGRMDPSEPGIANVTLRLYRDPDGNTQGNNAANGDEVLVATTTTDTYGRYIFSFSGASNGLNAQTWQTGHTKVLPNVKYQIRINNFASDAGLTTFATGAGSPTFVMSPTQNQGPNGGQRDNNAYNNPGNAAVAVATGGAGDNDHSFDFAFGPGGACFVNVAPSSNTPCVGETLNLDANPTGGTTPYTYNWAGPNAFASTAANPSIANVTTAADGNYSVTVTDANGCTGTFTFAVQINSITASAVATNASCGMSNGSINLTVTGGFTPYGFDWSDNAFDGIEDPTGVPAGSYMVTVSEANGCTAKASVNVNTTGGPSIGVASTNPTCGNSNGTVTLTPSGGASPYTFDWGHIAGASNPQNLTGLAPGTYMVTMTDNVGCSAAASVVLVDNTTAMTATIVATNAACGNLNGTLTLTVTGGSPAYNYDWSNLSGTNNPQNQTGLAAGTYTVTVTDGNSCTTVTSATISATTGPTLVTASVNETCTSANGSIDLTVNGGTSPYTYDWSNDGAESPDNDPQDLSNMSAGTYTVTVTDANGCTAMTGVTLTNAAAPTLATTAANTTSCGVSNGSINLTVTGGMMPYLYDWNNDGDPAPDNDTEDLSGLSTGTYTVTVTDGNGCTVTANAFVGINNGASLSAVITDPATCAQTGSVDLTITGGVAPFSIDWSNNGVGQTNDPQDLTGLAAGNYSVTVTEANGCTSILNASIRDLREPVGTFTLSEPSCGVSNGAIDLTVVPGDGVGPYTVDWAHVPGAPNPEDQNGLTAGTYTVTITDELLCSSVLTVNLSASSAPQLTIIQTNETCGNNNGALDMTITGGVAPYSIDWDNNGIGQTNDPEDLTGLAAGTYNVSVTDASGCQTNATLNVTNTTTPTATALITNANSPANDGEIDLVVTEIGPFTFDWNDNALDGQQNPTGLAPGTYTVTVTDFNGCTAERSATVAATSVCAITGITFGNQSACNNAGTNANGNDDYFTADIIVTFSGPPATGTLDLTGDVLTGGGATSVSVATAGAGPTYTFSGVRLRADGTASAVTATFSAESTCTFAVTNGPNVLPCSSCNPPCGTTTAVRN
jgi:SdrD B-like domain/SprB repeat